MIEEYLEIKKELKGLKEILNQIYLSKNNAVVKPLPETSNKFIGIKEASEVLNLAVPTIYSKVSRNELPYYKLDGSKRLYFIKKELEEFIKSSRMATEAELVNNIENLN